MNRTFSAILAGIMLVTLVALLPHRGAANERFSLDMRGADIREFINTVARLMDKTIIMDERVRGNVDIQSHRELRREEIYEIFLLQLGVSGFSVVDMGGGILKVIPNQAAKIEGTAVLGDENPAQRSEAIVTRVAEVHNVDVDKLVPTLRPLVDTRTGVITPYSDSNVILITDRESNVRRLLSIIEQVDRTDSQTVETVPLDNASAGEIERILSRLVADQFSGGAVGRPLISADARTNSLILYGDANVRAYLRELIEELDGEVRENRNLRVHYLRYAQAAEMADVLRRISESMISPGGQTGVQGTPRVGINIEAHEQTNAVVLSGSPDIIRSLDEVIRNLDIRRAQVHVEAIIIEMSDSRAKELGVQWLFRGAGRDQPVGGAGFDSAAVNIYDAAAAAAGDNLDSLLGGLNGVTAGVARLRDGSFSFASLVTALASDSDSNILSTPSLLTMDNQESSILVGQEVPIITGSRVGSDFENPFQTFSRQDIGIKLTVTPRINEGNAVQLDILQEVSSLSGLTAADIITNKRTIETTVLVDDGATIVLGGLIDDDVQESTEKVPVMGDMPIVGRLFRADRTRVSKRNLMVFIRPTILRDAQTMSSLSHEKYNYIRARQLVQQHRGVNLFNTRETPVLPAWTGMDPSPPALLSPREQSAPSPGGEE